MQYISCTIKIYMIFSFNMEDWCLHLILVYIRFSFNFKGSFLLLCRTGILVLANNLAGGNSWLFSVTGKYRNVDSNVRLLRVFAYNNITVSKL